MSENTRVSTRVRVESYGFGKRCRPNKDGSDRGHTPGFRIVEEELTLKAMSEEIISTRILGYFYRGKDGMPAREGHPFLSKNSARWALKHLPSE